MSHEISIAPEFSVYQLVQRIEERSTLLNHRRTMSLISYEIENATLTDRANTYIFAGFQTYSKFLPQVERYTRLARDSKAVYVFGIKDIEPPQIPNIIYVPLTKYHQLAKEWFLVSYGPEYCSALATEELTDLDDPDETRMFKGIWTFDLQFISILFEWLADSVGLRSAILNAGQQDHRNQVKLMTNAMGRLLMRIMREQNSQKAAIVQGELKTIVKDSIQQSILSMTQSEPVQELAQKDVVMLFSSLRNLSEKAADIGAQQLVKEIINPHLETTSKRVQEQGGLVDKVFGDGVLAVFYVDDTLANATQRAVTAAKNILTDLRERYTMPPPIGIGVAKGSAFVGQIAVAQHQESTIIGDVVHIAQYLSELGNDNVWVSDQVYNELGQQEEFSKSLMMMVNNSRQPAYCLRFN